MRYRIHDALQEALANSGTDPILEAPDLWNDVVAADVNATALAEEWPWIQEWLEILVALVGERSVRAPPPPAALATSVEPGDRPPSEQVTLSTALAD